MKKINTINFTAKSNYLRNRASSSKYSDYITSKDNTSYDICDIKGFIIRYISKNMMFVLNCNNHISTYRKNIVNDRWVLSTTWVYK